MWAQLTLLITQWRSSGFMLTSVNKDEAITVAIASVASKLTKKWQKVEGTQACASFASHKKLQRRYQERKDWCKLHGVGRCAPLFKKVEIYNEHTREEKIEQKWLLPPQQNLAHKNKKAQKHLTTDMSISTRCAATTRCQELWQQ